MSYRVHKKRVKGKKIVLPVDTQLEKTKFENLDHVFVVDLTSYSKKKCNALLHQLLFGKIKDNTKTKVVVVMKAKFSPACECGVGERYVDTIFYKDRFIVESEDRVVLQLTKEQSSKIYCSQVINYLIELYPYGDSRVYTHSEDYIDSSCTTFSLITPESETKKYLDLFELGLPFTDDQSNQSNQSTNNSSTPSKSSLLKSNNNTPSKKTSIGSPYRSATKKPIYGFKKQQQSNEFVTNEKLETKVTVGMEKWLAKRTGDPEDIKNLPKTKSKLENAIKKFCLVNEPSPIQPILRILATTGDIVLCVICQSCKPTNPDATSFYYSRGQLDQSMMDHCRSVMNIINTTYTSKNNAPVSLNSLTACKLKDKFQLNPATIVARLIESGAIVLEDDQETIKSYNNQTIQSLVSINLIEQLDLANGDSNSNQTTNHTTNFKMEPEYLPEKVDYSFFD